MTISSQFLAFAAVGMVLFIVGAFWKDEEREDCSQPKSVDGRRFEEDRKPQDHAAARMMQPTL